MKKENNHIKDQNRLKVLRLIFERIFYEGTFYGLMVGGYLAWTAMLYFLKYDNSNMIDIVYALFVIFIWILQIVLYMRSDTESFDLKICKLTQMKLDR